MIIRDVRRNEHFRALRKRSPCKLSREIFPRHDDTAIVNAHGIGNEKQAWECNVIPYDGENTVLPDSLLNSDKRP